jgi:hypothetical protein
VASLSGRPCTEGITSPNYIYPIACSTLQRPELELEPDGELVPPHTRESLDGELVHYDANCLMVGWCMLTLINPRCNRLEQTKI